MDQTELLKTRDTVSALMTALTGSTECDVVSYAPSQALALAVPGQEGGMRMDVAALNYQVGCRVGRGEQDPSLFWGR